MGLDLFATLQRHAADHGDDDAVRVIGPMAGTHPPLTWRDLRNRVIAVAARLDTALPIESTPDKHTDQVVMLISSNRPAVVPAFLGALFAGRTVFPIDAALTRPEIEQLIRRADVNAIIADDRVLPRLESLDTPVHRLTEWTEATPDLYSKSTVDRGEHGRLLLQSSGTTGGPKIVIRSGRSLDAVARNVAEAVGLRRDDRVVAAVPLSHSYGIENGMLAPLLVGACALHHVAPDDQPGRGFDPTLAITSGATVLPGVPAMFEMIDRMGAGRGQLRLAYSAGATLPTELADRLEARDGLRLGQLYGSTEIGSVTYGSDPASVGQPMQGVEARILDPQNPDPDMPLPDGHEGHVAVRAPSMFDRYFGPDADTTAAVVGGYFLTGDLGRCDPNGNLHITGRLKLLIDVGGVKVNPIEVEQVLSRHPHVAECVVVPDPVSPTINRVKAILTPTTPDFDERAVRAFLRKQLAAHKIPRTFEVRETLPKSPTGKVLRRELMVPA